MRAALALLAFAALAVPAAAQDACAEATPCTWFVDIDADGLHGVVGASWNFTVGDWFVLDATNFDDVEHTLTLEGHAVSLRVPAQEGARTAPFQFARAGTFQLRDERGWTGEVMVNPGDVRDAEEGLLDAGGGSGTSGAAQAPGLTAVAAALALALAGRRR